MNALARRTAHATAAQTSQSTDAYQPGDYYDVAALKRANPLDQVALDYGLRLLPAGERRFWALCPFHNDRRRPNLRLDLRDAGDEHFHCFAGQCRAHGDVIHFVMRLEGLDFRAACTLLARRAGLPDTYRQRAAGGRGAALSRPLRRWDHLSLDEQTVMNLAGAIYRRMLWQHTDALRYLQARGLPRWLIRRCALGWADGVTLAGVLARHRDPRLLPIALDLGLLRRGPSGRSCDALAGRIVVPEVRNGHYLWFIGRGLSASGGTTLAGAKYLALPGERPVLGQQWAARRPVVYACEGVFDWLAALAHHLPAWCPCGTHVSATALGFLARTRRVYGIFDGDAAGRAASARLGQLLGRRYRAVALPEGSDLNDLLQRPAGLAEFRALLAAACTYR
jgi:DNA primase